MTTSIPTAFSRNADAWPGAVQRDVRHCRTELFEPLQFPGLGLVADRLRRIRAMTQDRRRADLFDQGVDFGLGLERNGHCHQISERYFKNAHADLDVVGVDSLKRLGVCVNGGLKGWLLE